MKTLFYIISLVIVLSSCEFSKKDYTSTEVLNENKNTESIYGVLDLKLGTTTNKYIMLNKFNNNYLNDIGTITNSLMCRDSIGYNKYLNYDDKDKYLKILNKNLNKENIKIYFFFDYKYNNIKIENLELKFLNDILVDIKIYTDYVCYKYNNSNDETINFNLNFLNILTDKYGKGIGYIKTISEYNTIGKQYITTNTEKRIWKNSNVKVEYNIDYFIDYFEDTNNDNRKYSDNAILNYKLINSNIDSLLTKITENSIAEYNNIIKKEKDNKLENIKSNM